MADTTARVMTLNVRHDIAELYPSRRWTNRRGELMKMIKQVAPSIIGVQECDPNQAAYIETMLGAQAWAFFGTHNTRIFVGVEKWRLLNWWQFPLAAGTLGPTRYLVACHLQKIETGGTALLCSTHLTHYNNAYGRTWRGRQAHQIGGILKTLPDNQKTVLMADLNDSAKTTGVRGILATYGLLSARRRLTTGQMYAEQLNTFNGWKTTQSDGVWIDDVLTGPHIKPYKAGVERTDTKRPLKVVASDHNGLRLSFAFKTATETIT